MSRQTFRCRLSATVTDYNRDYVFSSLVQRFTGFNPQISVPQGNLFTLTVDTDGYLTPSVIKEKLIHSSFVESVSTGDTKKQVIRMPQMQAAKKFVEYKDTREHAGLMVKAKDTGRILLIQTKVDKKSPNRGKWELPGGHVEEGEDHLECAIREWEEEVGCKLPKGKIKAEWQDGRFRTFLYTIKREDKVTINPTKKTEEYENPDNPKRDPMDVVAWWDPDDIEFNSYLRDDIYRTNWTKVRKADFIKESPDFAHGEGINGTPLTDTASNNPLTEEQGVSGVTEKGMTGAGQRSYTIGDSIASSNDNFDNIEYHEEPVEDKAENFYRELTTRNLQEAPSITSVEQEHPEQKHYDFLRENARRFYDAGGTIEIHRVSSNLNLSCAKELKEQADRLNELAVSLTTGLTNSTSDRPRERLLTGIGTTVSNLRELAHVHQTGALHTLEVPDVYIFARDKDKNVVGSIRVRNVLDDENIESNFQTRLKQYEHALRNYHEHVKAHEELSRQLNTNNIEDEWTTNEPNFNSIAYPSSPPRKPTRDDQIINVPEVHIAGLGSTGQVVGTGSAIQHALLHHILYKTLQPLESSYAADAFKFHEAIGRRVSEHTGNSSTWNAADVIKLVENTKIPNERVTIKD